MSSVTQTVVRGGQQAISEEKALRKLYQTPIHVCAKTAFVG
jgi:hypothetical protein